MTIRELAKVLGVSPATVSRVINHKAQGHVSEEKQELVMKAIVELGYTPSKLAQALRKQRTETLGVVVPDISNPFFSLLARGVETCASKHGFMTFICDSNHSPEREERHINNLISARVEGMVIVPTGEIKRDIFKKLLRYDINVVAADRRISKIPVVEADNLEGSRKLTHFVIEHGYSHIAYVAGPPNVCTAQDRLKGFLSALGEYDLAAIAVFYGDFTYHSGYKAGKVLLEKLPSSEGVIMCGNDLMAVGVIQALAENSYKVPDDFGVTGFDGLPIFTTLGALQLCTVKVPAFDIGFAAAKMIVTGKCEDIVLPVELVPGATIRTVLYSSGKNI